MEDEKIDLSKEIKKLHNPFDEPDPGERAAAFFRELTGSATTTSSTTTTSITTNTSSTATSTSNSGTSTSGSGNSTATKPGWNTTKPSNFQTPQIGANRIRTGSANDQKLQPGEPQTARATSDPTSEKSRAALGTPRGPAPDTPVKPVLGGAKQTFAPKSPIPESPMKKPDTKQETINAYVVKHNREAAITEGTHTFPQYFDPKQYGTNVKQLIGKLDEIASDKKFSLEPSAFSDVVFFYCVSMATEETLPFELPMNGKAPELKKLLLQPYRDCTEAIQKKMANNDIMKMETLDQFRSREQKLFKQQIQHAAYQLWPHEAEEDFKSKMTPLLEAELQKFITFNAKEVNSGIFRLTTSENVRAINNACAASNLVNAKAAADELISLFNYTLPEAERTVGFNALADEGRAKRATAALKSILKTLMKQQLPRELRWWLKEVNRLLAKIAAEKSKQGVKGDMKPDEFLNACKLLPVAQLFLNGGYGGISMAIIAKGDKIDSNLAKGVWAGVMGILNQVSSGKPSDKGKWPKTYTDFVDSQVPVMTQFLNKIVDDAIAEKFD